MTLKGMGEMALPCLVSDLNEKASILSPLRMMLNVGFFHILYQVEQVPLIFSLRVFIRNGCWVCQMFSYIC